MKKNQNTSFLNKRTITRARNIGFALGGVLVASHILGSDAYAAGTAVPVPFLDNLAETSKEFIKGSGSYIIDGLLIAGGGYASARTSTPAPLIGSLATAGIFEVFVKIIFG